VFRWRIRRAWSIYKCYIRDAAIAHSSGRCLMVRLTVWALFIVCSVRYVLNTYTDCNIIHTPIHSILPFPLLNYVICFPLENKFIKSVDSAAVHSRLYLIDRSWICTKYMVLYFTENFILAIILLHGHCFRVLILFRTPYHLFIYYHYVYLLSLVYFIS